MPKHSNKTKKRIFSMSDEELKTLMQEEIKIPYDIFCSELEKRATVIYKEILSNDYEPLSIYCEKLYKAIDNEFNNLLENDLSNYYDYEEYIDENKVLDLYNYLYVSDEDFYNKISSCYDEGDIFYCVVLGLFLKQIDETIIKNKTNIILEIIKKITYL